MRSHGKGCPSGPRKKVIAGLDDRVTVRFMQLTLFWATKGELRNHVHIRPIYKLSLMSRVHAVELVVF